MITAQEAQAQAILSQARVSIIGKYEPRVTKINLKKIFRRKGKAYDLCDILHHLANMMETKL